MREFKLYDWAAYFNILSLNCVNHIGYRVFYKISKSAEIILGHIEKVKLSLKRLIEITEGWILSQRTSLNHQGDTIVLLFSFTVYKNQKSLIYNLTKSYIHNNVKQVKPKPFR